MSTADGFLIAWWMLIAVIGILFSTTLQRRPTSDDRDIQVAYLRGELSGPKKYAPLGSRVSKPAGFTLGAVLLALIVGGVVFLWMSHWTALLVFNFFLVTTIFGAWFVVAGLARNGLPAHSTVWRLPRAVMRPTMILFGAAALAFGLHHAIGDFALSRLFVEGRIDRVRDSWGGRRTSSITINGKRYDATREAIAHCKVGDRVRAEIGVGSDTVYRLQPM